MSALTIQPTNEHLNNVIQPVGQAGPSSGPFTPTSLSRTSSSLSHSSSKSSISRTGKSKGKTRSSLSRQASGSSSALDRAAESARKARVKTKVANAAQPKRANIIVRSLKFLWDKLVPFRIFRTIAEPEVPDETSGTPSPTPSSPSLSSVSLSISDSIEQTEDVAAVVANFANVNVNDAPTPVAAKPDDADDLSDASTEIMDFDDNQYNPNNSFKLTYVDSLTEERPRPVLSNAKLRQFRQLHAAQLERAEAHAVKEAQKERERRHRFERMKAIYGEKEAVWKQFGEEIEEKRKLAAERHRDALEDEQDHKERRALLLSGRREAMRAIRHRDGKVRDARENLLKLLGLHTTGSPASPCNHDNTTKSRRVVHARFHPYPTGVRPFRLKACRYFNASQTPVGDTWPISVPPDPSKVEDEEHGLIFEVLFPRYEMLWIVLSKRSTKMELTFSTVPWPVKDAPCSPDSIAAREIEEFLLIGHLGGWDNDEDIPMEECKRIALYELERWTPDNVANWILPRIANAKEREAVLVAADLVLKALIRLST